MIQIVEVEKVPENLFYNILQHTLREPLAQWQPTVSSETSEKSFKPVCRNATGYKFYFSIFFLYKIIFLYLYRNRNFITLM